MTDKPQKDAAAVRFPPPGVPLVVILGGVGLEHLWPIDPGLALPAAARYTVGGLIVLGALLFALWAVVVMRRTGQSELPWTPTPSIIGRGPYRISRNPMYLQMVVVCIGFAIALMNVWILALTPIGAWLLYRIAIVPEEAYLEAKFGEAYLDYKRRVRRWL